MVLPAHTLDSINVTKKITEEDVLSFRRTLFGDHIVSADEAVALCRVNDMAPDVSPEIAPQWHELFVEVMADYVLIQDEGSRVVTKNEITWLQDHLTEQGVVKNELALQALIKILERAEEAPTGFADFVLSQLKEWILRRPSPSVTEQDVKDLRRALFAFSGDRNIGVSRNEAEVLFDLNDATEKADNAPEWQEFFIKSIVNYIMAAFVRRPIAKAETLSYSEGMKSGWADMLSILSGRYKNEYQQFNQDRNDALVGSLEETTMVTVEEGDWLAGRIERDGVVGVNEIELLKFLKAEAPSIEGRIKDLIGRWT